MRGSIGQSRFICQFLCTGMQGISALVLGGPLAKVGSSAKFCVLVFKESLLWYQGGPSAKVGSSAKFCVLVFKASQLWYWGDFWSSRNNRKPLSKQKCVLKKCSAVSQKWWMLELSNLCHCVQHPWKLTSRDFWRSRNTSKPLSKLKHVLRKCSIMVSQKWWMLDLSNLCPCVHHLWKLTGRDFWSSKNVVCDKCSLWSISRWCSFKPLDKEGNGGPFSAQESHLV